MQIQIGLALFNLLVPVYPLDCSRILQALCQLLGMSAAWAATTICIVSGIFIGLILASMLGLVRLPIIGMGYSPILLLIVVFASYETYRLWGHASQQTLRQHPLFSGTREEELPLQ